MSDSMALYKKKFRTETNRLRNHAYDEGIYFVTVCTQQKMQWFGEVKDGKMLLSDVGEIVADEWVKTSKIRPYVFLDEWCIMPNHIHGIIVIGNVETARGDVSLSESPKTDAFEHVSFSDESNRGNSERSPDMGATETRAPHVSTKAPQNFSLKPKTLGSILNQFKGIVTKRAKAVGFSDFHWQSRYHDRIIRSDVELAAVKKYIAGNPEQWDKEMIPWHADAASWSL